MIDEFFKKNFLEFQSFGSDHEIFFNTPTDLMPIIAEELRNQCNESQSTAITSFNNSECSLLDNTLYSLINSNNRPYSLYQIRSICSAYVRTKILLSVIESHKNKTNEDLQNISLIEKLLENFHSQDINLIIDAYTNSPLDLDIENEIKRNPRTNIALFESDINSNLMQSAINNYIGSRTRYSMKVFTNQPRLHNNYDTSGNLVSPIHDYRAIDLDKYLHNEEPTA